MTRLLAIITILLANALIGAAYLLQQVYGGALACLILAAIWLAFCLRGTTWIPSACFVVLASLSAFSLAVGSAPILAFLGFWVGLAAWDLSGFWARFKPVEPEPAAARLEKLHLSRLAYTLTIGLVLGLAGLFFRLQLQFVPAFLLVILAFFALAFAVRGLIKKDSNGA